MDSLYATVKYLDDAPDGSSDALSKLTAHSETIVIGTVSSNGPSVQRIAGRNPADDSEIDPSVTSVGNVYNVQIERYLKGSGESAISVIQSIVLDVIQDGETMQFRDTSENLLPQKSSRYVFFLQEHPNAAGMWTGTVQPYKFLLSGGQAKVESPVGDRGGAFPEQSESDFISSVEEKIDVGT